MTNLYKIPICRFIRVLKNVLFANICLSLLPNIVWAHSYGLWGLPYDGRLQIVAKVGKKIDDLLIKHDKREKNNMKDDIFVIKC